ncbi:ceramidase domain-containing protein [Spirosoma sp. BT702]|uniref:Ceramidase domain-containing protein n=1 Tax=Spirosoma profusum TaxID=2771354 RepID=A0A927AUE8_9BACT|nr:ceramidase domain-containing protein [Spirosoma profusum]MBD2703932.1 ceramidase domain-containing protein [Spirosoma profusum]
MKNQFRQLTFRSATYTLAMIAVFFLLNTTLTGHIWEGMTVSKSALTGEYCEFNDVGNFFHQSVNTYSNLVYFFFGIFICQLALNDHKNQPTVFQNRIQQFPLLSLLMGVCLIYLSVGSAFFHASLTWIGQRVDMNGTYGVSVTLLIIALYHVFHRINLSESAKRVFIGIVILLILSFYEIHLLIPSSILLPTLILTTWVLITINYFQFRRERSIWLAISSIVLIVVALKIRALDVQKIGCDPHSLYQGHSVWHLLAGLSSFLSYAFFRFTPSSSTLSPP